jgi:arylformamidase
VLLGHGAGGHLAAMLSCCDWKLVGGDLPRRLVQGAISLSGVHDLAPLRRVPAIDARLQLDVASVRRLSPVNFPRPAAPQTLLAVVGAQESEEFRRQTRAIRHAWGARAVPVCEELPGHDHFTLMHDLADPQGRTHQLARQLLGLRWYSGLL